MKKFFYYALALVAPAAVFAEGEGSSSPTIDLSAAGSAAGEIGQAVHDLLTGDVLNACKWVAGGILVIWAFWRVLRWCGVGRR